MNKNALFLSAVNFLQAYLDNIWIGLDFLRPGPPDITHVRSADQFNRYDGEFAVLDFVGMVEQHGYQVEEFSITTSDYYKITLHRISGTPFASNVGKPVVFLQHGLFGSSDTFVFMGPKISLAFQLADAGYDVFLGNVRGNTYSRSHQKIDPILDHKEFWEFTMHEMVIYDLTALIDSTLTISGAKSLIYVGYSMGTNLGNILLSHLPSYNEKISLMINLAPTIFFENNNSTLMNYVREYKDVIRRELFKHQVYEVLPQSRFTFFLGKILCKDEQVLPSCKKVLGLLTNVENLPYYKIAKIATYLPSGSSYFALISFFQLIESGGFGGHRYVEKVINFKHYKDFSPPNYDLSKIRTRVAILYGLSDSLNDEKDVKKYRNQINNAVYCKSIDDPKFNHFDFVTSDSAKRLVTSEILHIIRNYGQSY